MTATPLKLQPRKPAPLQGAPAYRAEHQRDVLAQVVGTAEGDDLASLARADRQMCPRGAGTITIGINHRD